MEKRLEVFIAYAHKDELLRRQLDTHLTLLKRQGSISVWHDQDIDAGVEWEKEMSAHLDVAQIILLLVSPDFMASDYCYSIAMRRAMDRYERKEAYVIPIILRPVNWKNAPFGKLQVLPSNGKPVTKWLNRDDAFLDIAKGIQKVIQEPTYSFDLPPQAIVPIGLPRSATFVGREAELKWLIEQLKAGHTSGIFALHGMGGI